MEPDASTAIPGVGDDELRAAFRNLGSVPEASANDQDRFAIEIRTIAESRAQGGWPGEDENSDIGTFVHTPYPREVGNKFGALPVAHLIATGRPILGKLFFLNRDASNGRVINMPTNADAIVDWLIDNGLGEHTAVFVYRKSKLMLARANGAKSDLTRKEIIRDKRPVATVDEISEALRLIHLQFLLSPTVCPPGVWERGREGQYVPGSAPEKAVQRAIRTGLGGWFRGVVRAEQEDTVSVGRIDVRLLQEQPDGKLAYWAIIELKVLRSFHNAKGKKAANPVSLSVNAAGVAKGVRQVHAFAKNRGAEKALLEIFDLRKSKEDDVMKEKIVVTELAKCSPKPTCRVWPLFGSAEDARVAGFS